MENGGVLTALGRDQAAVTGRWISEHLSGSRVNALWSSTLPRARETASIIAHVLGDRSSPLEVRRSREPRVTVRSAAVLREGMYSNVRGHEVPPKERKADRARADAAWLRFFRTCRMDRLEIVVCHGNLIRYLVCRALHTPVIRWTRMNSNHCSLTRILVRDTGAIRVVSYNETAHLPVSLVT
jgi:serine/threonine-protein phosphatase PGAM5